MNDNEKNQPASLAALGLLAWFLTGSTETAGFVMVATLAIWIFFDWLNQKDRDKFNEKIRLRRERAESYNDDDELGRVMGKD